MAKSEPNSKHQQIPLEDRVFRIVVNTQRARDNKRIPSTSCFSLTKADKLGDYSLSVDWERKTTAEECIARVGCSYKNGTTTFKDYRNREIYALDVSFLSNLTEVEKVISTPIFHNPVLFGRPNNPAHASVFFRQRDYDQHEPELLLKIREHAKNNLVPFNMNEVEMMITNYRNTSF